MAATNRPCSICAGERKTVVNTLLAAGRSPHFIEGEMRKVGSPTKAETVRRHLARCLNGQRPGTGTIVPTGAKGDFAQMVRDEAVRLLEAGELKVKTNDGLWAQGLIDKRAEKKADRDLLLNLTRLMVGAAPPPELIEGEWTEVNEDTPLRLPG